MTEETGIGQVEIDLRADFLEMKFRLERRQWKILLDERSATHLLFLLRQKLQELPAAGLHETKYNVC